MKIWLPDGMSSRVEWYLSENKAFGVESFSDDWVPHEVVPKQSCGFDFPYDPERDDFVARDRKK